MTEITAYPYEDEHSPKLRLRFDYDPTIVAAIKGLPWKKWDPTTKTWSIAERDRQRLAAALPAHAYLAEQVDHAQAMKNLASVVEEKTADPRWTMRIVAAQLREIAERLDAALKEITR